MLRLWMLRDGPDQPAACLAATCAVLSCAWLTVWAALDWWERRPSPEFFAAGVPLIGWYVCGVLALAALLGRGFGGGQTIPNFSRRLVLALGFVPFALLSITMIVYAEPLAYMTAASAIALYGLLYFSRGLRLTGERPHYVPALLGLAFVVAFAWCSDRFDAVPDIWNPSEIEGGARQAKAADADAEAVLFDQSQRIDAALSGISRASSPDSQAFFLGFAGVGDQRVFTQEVALASRVLGRRYGMHERTLSLINDDRDLDSAPIASLTSLRYALRGISARMDTARDILFLSISSHGAENPVISVANSQLPLNDLSPDDLSDALRDAGIQWRVIIISACYAGGFIDSLRNSQTIVITAAAADRTSFGCSNDSELTYFGEAFYRDALPTAPSLRTAFDIAKAAIGQRERDERQTPSNPQAYFGSAIEVKLSALFKHQGSAAGLAR